LSLYGLAVDLHKELGLVVTQLQAGLTERDSEQHELREALDSKTRRGRRTKEHRISKAQGVSQRGAPRAP
jgi:hypothetical protein